MSWRTVGNAVLVVAATVAFVTIIVVSLLTLLLVEYYWRWVVGIALTVIGIGWFVAVTADFFTKGKWELVRKTK